MNLLDRNFAFPQEDTDLFEPKVTGQLIKREQKKGTVLVVLSTTRDLSCSA